MCSAARLNETLGIRRENKTGFSLFHPPRLQGGFCFGPCPGGILNSDKEFFYMFAADKNFKNGEWRPILIQINFLFLKYQAIRVANLLERATFFLQILENWGLLQLAQR